MSWQGFEQTPSGVTLWIKWRLKQLQFDTVRKVPATSAKRFMKLFLTAILLLCLPISQVHAQDEKGTFALILDNDLFTGTDRDYTNGLRLSWLSEPAQSKAPGFFGSGYAKQLKDLLRFLPVYNAEHFNHSASLSLQQVMVTPENISTTQLLPDQAPYIGYLELSTALYAWDETEFHKLELMLGIVGPGSGAGDTQIFMHKLLDSKEPKGWANQISERHILGLSFTEGHRLVRRDTSHDNKAWDLTLDYALDLSNLKVSAAAGGLLRWGHNLPYNFNAYYTDHGGESALLGLFDSNQPSAWMVYAGVVVSGIAYSYVEEAIKDTHNFSPNHITGSAVIGANYIYGGVQFGVSLQTDSPAVKERDSNINFGSIYLIWNI